MTKTSKALVIVESPAKIKTLKKFLGKGYIFESSVGHIRDLPQKEFGIDVEKNFAPHYVSLPDKKEVIRKLQEAAKEVDLVYLSPDPDREGEAIAWHIASILPKGTRYVRAAFQSITKSAVQEALANPRELNMDLIYAQQARRLLDRMVGYKISPLLTRRVSRAGGGASSAGRVQSVALKLVVDRERAIEAFVAVEYWNLTVQLAVKSDERPFTAYLYSVEGIRVEKEAVVDRENFLIPNADVAQRLVDRLQKSKYRVHTVENKEKKRNPPPPFITSTLQQEANRHFGYSVSRTMSLAQTLYEGVELGEGAEGLITYMRTDSVHIAPEAVQAARQYIAQNFSGEYLPDQPRFFANKKTAQEAHEAIRPANLERTPEEVQPYLAHDQFQLYQLIWRRFIASQMSHALYDTVSADIEASEGMILRATGSILRFPGYLAAYEEKRDAEEEREGDKKLPLLIEGTPLHFIEVNADQSFTKPPARFTEASLVKELERLGIGRPSTYAAIMNKIQSRDYTVKEQQALKPTEFGQVVCQLLEANFAPIMDVNFTAQMEDQLEQVAEHDKNWVEVIREFWENFVPLVEKAEKEAVVPKIPTDLKCPKCSKHLLKIWAKRGYFYGCSGYPDCDFTTSMASMEFRKEDYDPNFNWDSLCPVCNHQMTLRYGKFGPFLGCSRYPECQGILNIPKKGEEHYAPESMPTCPAIECTGRIVARRSRFGKIFFSCSNYPDCDVIGSKLEELPSKYINHPKTPYVSKKKKWGKGKKEKATPIKKAAGKKSKATHSKATSSTARKDTTAKKTASRQQKTYQLSKELTAVLGEKALARPEVVKKIWAYIKEHRLQDPNNGRMILPDEKLSKVLGKGPVNMLKIAGLLNSHLQ